MKLLTRWHGEIVAALVVFAGAVGTSVVAGVGWGFLAPGEHLVVAEPGRAQSLPGESDHYFDAVALFALIGVVVAVIVATAAWRWRAARGPILFAGILLGTADGAREMMFVGEWVARLRFPEHVAPDVGTVLVTPPRIDTLAALVMMPLIAGMVVLLLAALDTSDDLRAPAAAPVPPPAS